MKRGVVIGTAAFSALLGVVLLCQPNKVGFEQGHHGWVSSHTLAIIARATPENGLVGHAWRFSEDGRVLRGYFDRYPVLFAAAMRAGLSQVDDSLAARVIAARNFMNVIYALTGLFSYLFLGSLLQSRTAAFCGTLLALSGTYFVHYKDMIHFDQPALLGVAMVFYGVAAFEFDARRGPLLFAAVVAPVLGRGYVSVAILAYWAGLRVVRARVSGAAAAGRASTAIPIAVAALAATLATSALLYNTLVEARVNDVPVGRTSIVESAKKRLGFLPSFNDEHAQDLAWATFLPLQANRAYEGMLPLAYTEAFERMVRGARAEGASSTGYRVAREALRVVGQLLAAAVLLIALFVVGHFDRPRRWVAAVVTSVGFLWIVAMRNLTAFHDYTAIYFLGFQLCVFGGFALAMSKRLPRTLVALSLSVFLVSHVANLGAETSVALRVDGITRDFDAIRERLGGTHATVYVGDRNGYFDFIEGRPFALGFLGSDYEFVLAPEDADFFITKGTNEPAPGVSLTPENELFFLYRNVPGPSRPTESAAPGA